MTARVRQDIGLRPMLPDDLPLLTEIFRASVEELAADDYSEAQIEAWSSAADEPAFAKELTEQLTLIATLDGAPVGFASLKGNERLEMLYVYPSAAGRGVGTALVDALERLAQARGAKKLSVDASDSAQEFFKRRGYTPQSRNSVLRGGEWLANTTMEKPLETGSCLQ